MPESPLPNRLLRLINGYQITQAIYVAATIGVADHLSAGPRGIADLAKATGTHAPSLYRVLRALAAEGLFEELDGGKFALTEMGELLGSDAPLSVRGWGAMVGRPYVWQAWSELLDGVHSGHTPFVTLNGTDVWSYRRDHPEESAVFDEAMTSMTRLRIPELVAAYDFGRFQRVVDVGGGHGALLAAILRAHPNVTGVLFDLPHVVAAADEVLGAAGVLDRCELVPGSIFESLPPGDGYVLKGMLNSFDDDGCVALLRRVRSSATAGARLIAIDQVVGPPNQGSPGKFSDLTTLVMTGGRERTRNEFEALFEASGFRLDEVYPAGQQSIIEGVLA